MKEYIVRYLVNAITSNWKDVFLVTLKKLGININPAWLEKQAVLESPEEQAILNQMSELSGTDLKDMPALTEEEIYVIDQGMRTYTLYACVPTSHYLALCRSVQQVPDWDFYMTMLKHMADTGKWNVKSGANSSVVWYEMVKYWNKLKPDMPVEIKKSLWRTDLLEEAGSKWYRGVLCYKNNQGYSDDRADKKIDSSNYTGSKIWGHCIGAIVAKFFKAMNVRVLDKNGVRDYTYDKDLIETKDTDIIILDNYPDKFRGNNFYIHNKLEDHMKNDLYSSTIFFYVAKFDLKPKEKTYSPVEGNRYFHLIQNDIDNGYKPIFNDLFEKGELNAGETKTLLEIYNIRQNGNKQ